MTVNRKLFSTLDKLLLAYSFGAALGVVVFVFLFKALGLLVEIPLFLVPTALGFHLITRAFRAGARDNQGSQAQI